MSFRTRLSFLVLASAALAPTASAQACVYAGNVPSYVGCIADQAWEALELAMANAQSIADDECASGYTEVAGSCIDLTCRGMNEVEDVTVEYWQDAQDTCVARGARLCTPSEVANTVNGGCGFDTEVIAVSVATDTHMGMVRGQRFQNNGSCTAVYSGEQYTFVYPDLPPCQSTLVALNNDYVDGFMCCQ